MVNGRVAMGDAKVESTASSEPASCAMSAIAAISHSRKIGLAGVSIHTKRVFEETAFSTFGRYDVSIGTTLTPNRGRDCRASSAVPG